MFYRRRVLSLFLSTYRYKEIRTSLKPFKRKDIEKVVLQLSRIIPNSESTSWFSCLWGAVPKHQAVSVLKHFHLNASREEKHHLRAWCCPEKDGNGVAKTPTAEKKIDETPKKNIKQQRQQRQRLLTTNISSKKESVDL